MASFEEVVYCVRRVATKPPAHEMYFELRSELRNTDSTRHPDTSMLRSRTCKYRATNVVG